MVVGKTSVKLTKLFILFLLLLSAGSSLAESTPAVLEPVTVLGVAESRLNGQNTISAEQIRQLPRSNGSLNELLTLLPGVQDSDLANTSLQGGEILPPSLSISGGRFYDNNFMVDGIGNNSITDPAEDDPEAKNDLPGNPQELFLDADLIGEVTVYRYNIPVEFGGFTGGVVDAETRMPAAEFGGRIDLRTTRSTWTEFHLDDEDEENFSESNSVFKQPNFRKYRGGIRLDLPLQDNMGLLLSYRQTHSKIPLQHFEQKRDQTRKLETFFVKLAHDLSERTSINLSFIRTPYEEKRFREVSQDSEVKDSWYTLDTDSQRFAGEISHDFSFGTMELKGAFKHSKTRRDAPSNYFVWRTKPDSWEEDWDKDWGTRTYSKEGGYGDLESSQKSQTVTASLQLDPVNSGPIRHEIKLGAGFERVTGTYKRQDTSYAYTVISLGIDADIICQPGDVGCIAGQQYATYRTVYTADSVKETINAHHLYLQDQLSYGRLTLRPGLRYATDNFMDNDDVDLRLAASVDLFGTGNTLLIGGLNRYHSRPLMAYRLAEAKKPNYTEKRSKDAATNTLSEWTLKAQSKSYKRYSELKTPYSDEWALGADQALLGGRLKLNYLERHNKDEFSQETLEADEEGRYFTILNNNGRSTHEEFSVEWERRWQRHSLTLNLTWQRTRTSNNSYSDPLEDEDLLNRVYYQGELMKKTDLPRGDFNRGYVCNLVYTAQLPFGFTFTNSTRYRSGFSDLEDSGEDMKDPSGKVMKNPNGDPIPVYEKIKQPESWIFDWRLDWRRDLYGNHGVQLSLELNNVFNQKVPAGTEETIQTYEIGRQLWAGLEYYF